MEVCPVTAPPSDSEVKAPQTSVLLSQVARDNLARLQAFYGTNITATLSFLLAEAVRRLPPPQPFTLPAPEAADVDGDELTARRVAQQFARGDFPRCADRRSSLDAATASCSSTVTPC